MDNLISRSDLVKEIKDLIYTYENPSVILTREGEEIFKSGVECALFEVMNAPAIDAVPVVHARWEADGTCSACKNRSFSLIRNEKDGAVNFVGGSYCPVCGARMTK